MIIKYLSWGEGFLRGVFSKSIVLRRGFKQITKRWRGYEKKSIIFQNFTNNIASQINYSVSHNLVILLQC